MSWRTRLKVRSPDFHSGNSSSILLCATNKKMFKKSFEERNLNIVGFESLTLRKT